MLVRRWARAAPAAGAAAEGMGAAGARSAGGRGGVVPAGAGSVAGSVSEGAGRCGDRRVCGGGVRACGALLLGSGDVGRLLARGDGRLGVRRRCRRREGLAVDADRLRQGRPRRRRRGERLRPPRGWRFRRGGREGGVGVRRRSGEPTRAPLVPSQVAAAGDRCQQQQNPQARARALARHRRCGRHRRQRRLGTQGFANDLRGLRIGLVEGREDRERPLSFGRRRCHRGSRQALQIREVERRGGHGVRRCKRAGAGAGGVVAVRRREEGRA